jgi:hypothetical protein
MSNNYFEKFVQQNRVEFDSETPSNKVWENIAKNLPIEKKAKVFSIKDIYKWSAAAAVFFVVLTSAYFLLVRKPDTPTETANIPTSITQPKSAENTIPQKEDTITQEIGVSPSTEIASAEDKPLVQPDPRDRIITKTAPSNNEPSDMFKIITAKQEELKELTKGQPYLYQEFTADLRTLESSYGVLKKQLKQTGNSDVIIKAMMQNLQLQAELLGRQLSIINNIKTNKQNEKSNSRYN